MCSFLQKPVSKLLSVLCLLSAVSQYSNAMPFVEKGKVAPTPQKMNSQLQSSPLLFTENKGQVADVNGKQCPDVLFTTRSGATQVFLKTGGIDYQFTKTIYPAAYKLNLLDTGIIDRSKHNELKKQIQTQTYRFSLELIGANKQATVRKENRNIFTENFYLPQCPQGITHVPTYERVVYENVYPNIDWVLYSKNGTFKYDFIVHPGGDPAQIKLGIKDAQGVSITKAGELLMKTTLGEVKELAPVSFIDGSKVPSHFKKNSDGSIGFDVHTNPTNTLVIDPSIVWSTYYGGTDNDEGSNCAVDGTGNVYLVGNAASTVSIASSGFQSTNGGGTFDAFLVKFDATGNRLWATYYGGSDEDDGRGCAIDANKNVYLAGYTFSTNVIAPTTGVHQSTLGGLDDAFLAKFDASGVRIWATYYGGTDYDDCYGGCAVDASGNVYMGGGAISATGIATPGAFRTTNNSGGNGSFLVKFNTSGTRLWGTYYGGPNSGIGGCATDAAGNIYICGYTYDATPNAIASAGSYQSAIGGSADGFLAKFDPSGNRLWGTYYGGSDFDNSNGAHDCIVDGNNVYLCGFTQSGNGIATSGAYQTTYSGTPGQSFDAFLSKFDAAGNRIWGTYYGGTGIDQGVGTTVNSVGDVYMSGLTMSNASISGGGFQNNFGGFIDLFLVKFDANGSRLWGSYFGGNGNDGCHYGGCATDAGGIVYLTGYASSGGLGQNGFQNTYGGTNDAVLVKIQDIVPPTISTDTGIFAGSGPNPGSGSDHAFCAGDTISVPFTVTGTINAGNTFTAQLSNAVGSFATPVVIGTTTGASSGIIVAVIPPGTTAGTGYRIRVVGSNPSVIGADNSIDITVLAGTAAPIVISPITYCQFDAADTLSAIGDGLSWYTSYTGTNALPGAPRPNTAVLDTLIWYVEQAATGVCPSLRDSVVVRVIPHPPVPVITAFTPYCSGMPFVPFTVKGQNVLWFSQTVGDVGNPTAPVVNTFVPGSYTYYATQTVDGCESPFDSVTVDVYQSVEAAFSEAIDHDCSMFDTVVFNNASSLEARYLWSFGDNSFDTTANPIHIYKQSGTYNVSLVAYNEHCRDTAKQRIALDYGSSDDMDKCNCKLFLPDVFSPNGDGKNDDYGPVSFSSVGLNFHLEQLSIMNRFGERIFYSNNASNRWDGTIHGVPAELGTYNYFLRATCTGKTNKTIEMKGTVTLIR